MDLRGEAMVCRECGALVRVSEGSCPDCGTRVRSLLAIATVVVLGLAALSLAISPFDVFSAFVGVALLGIGLAAATDRRRRVRAARERMADA